MKSSEIGTPETKRTVFDELMAQHDAGRAARVDWKKTRITLGEFARTGDDPFRELARATRRAKPRDGRSVGFDASSCGCGCSGKRSVAMDGTKCGPLCRIGGGRAMSDEEIARAVEAAVQHPTYLKKLREYRLA